MARSGARSSTKLSAETTVESVPVMPTAAAPENALRSSSFGFGGTGERYTKSSEVAPSPRGGEGRGEGLPREEIARGEEQDVRNLFRAQQQHQHPIEPNGDPPRGRKLR